MTQRETDRRAQQSAHDRAALEPMTAAERRAFTGSMTVSEWCAHRRLSRAMLYKMWGEGWGPAWHYVGKKRLISGAADAAWLAEREAQSNATPPAA